MFKSNFQLFIENAVTSILTLIKLVLLSKWNTRIPNSEKKHDHCVILTNGPSLNKSVEQLGSFLEGQDLVCVNHFPVSDRYEQLKPKYYVTSAPDLWLEDIEERFLTQSKKLFDTMTAKTTWSIYLFIPWEAKKYQRWQSAIKTNPNIKVIYFNNTPAEGFKWFRHLCFKKNLGMPRPHNVLIPCLMMALNMGYKNIKILGADHSWLPEISVTDDNLVLVHQKHFYDEGTSKAMPQDKKGKGARHLHELLMKYVHAFRGYFTIKEYAGTLNAKIYNATENSYIDAFERIKSDDLISEKTYI